MMQRTPSSLGVNWAAAANWFASEPDQGSTMDAKIKRLIGLTACAWVEPSASVDREQRRLASEVNATALRAGDDAFVGCDPHLVAFVAVAAQASAVAVDGMTSLLHGLVSPLEEQPLAMRSNPRAYELALFLSHLGLCKRPDPADLLAWEVPELATLFAAETGLLSRLSQWIISTAYAGRTEAAMARLGARAEVCDALTGIAVSECRAYHLGVAAELTRAMRAIGYDDPTLAEIRNFFAMQQREDGSFGFRNPFKSAPAQNDATRFHLPISVSAVLMLSEEARGRSILDLLLEQG